MERAEFNVGVIEFFKVLRLIVEFFRGQSVRDILGDWDVGIKIVEYIDVNWLGCVEFKMDGWMDWECGSVVG